MNNYETPGYFYVCLPADDPPALSGNGDFFCLCILTPKRLLR